MTSKENCWFGDSNVLSGALSRVGISRSLLVTLALVPFAWNGVVWVADALRELWGLIASV